MLQQVWHDWIPSKASDMPTETWILYSFIFNGDVPYEVNILDRDFKTVKNKSKQSLQRLYYYNIVISSIYHRLNQITVIQDNGFTLFTTLQYKFSNNLF